MILTLEIETLRSFRPCGFAQSTKLEGVGARAYMEGKGRDPSFSTAVTTTTSVECLCTENVSSSAYNLDVQQDKYMRPTAYMMWHFDSS